MANSLKTARNLVRRYFTSRGNLPPEVFDAYLEAKGEKSAIIGEVEQTLRDLKRAAKAELGSARLSPASIAVVDEALRQQTPHPSLGPRMQGVIDRMRDYVDGLSTELMASGAVDAETAEIIKSNVGEYLHRSYRVFDDPNWAKKVPQVDVDYARTYLEKEYPNETPEQIEGRIRGYLYEGKAAEGPVGFVRQRVIGQKDLGILKERFLPEPLRRLYGEYKDPAINFSRSSVKISHLIVNDRMLTKVRDELMGRLFFDRRTVNGDGEFIARISAENDPTMRPLDGLYTTPEIKQAMDTLFGKQSAPIWLQGYMRLNGIVKMSKTVLSAMTGIRNFISNYGFALASGNFHLQYAPEAFRTVLADFGIADSASYRKALVDARRYGVVGEGTRAGELRQLGKDTFHGSAAEKIVELPTRVYGAEDDIWKVYAWLNEQHKYRKAYPSWTDEQVKTKAAENVRNTHPTYAMVPEAIRSLRQFPLVGTFVSWPSEIVRVGYHTIDLAVKEMARPETRAIGMQRLVGILAAATLGDILAQGFMARFGITSDQDRDFRTFLPPWSQNSNILYLGRDKNDPKQVRYIDLGYSDAWSVLKKPVMAAMRGGDWKQSIVDAASQMAEPFIGEEILAGKLLDVSRNVTPQGKQIYNPQADFVTQTQQKLAHIWEALEPGTLTSLKRIQAGLQGKVGVTGKSYDPKVESLALLTGQRRSEVDVPQALQFKAMQFNKGVEDANRILNSVLARRGNVTPQEIAEAERQSGASRKSLFNELQQSISAARRLGMTDDEIWRALQNGGMSRRESSAMLLNRLKDYQPSAQFRRQMGKRGQGDEFSQRTQTLRDLRTKGNE